MNGDAAAWLRELTGRVPSFPAERLQDLWGGYGRLERLSFETGAPASVIVKRIRPPTAPRSPVERRSHERKLRSYEVERTFYAEYAARCSAACRVPRWLGSRHHGAETWLVLEDLAPLETARPSGLPVTRLVEAGLDWLAAFHATFLGDAGRNLWERGTYWHLATRPDELELVRHSRIGRAAPALDRALGRARYQTLVHGDAKLENFLFGPSGAAAVDFQYVGPGPGVLDVAYFLGSALPPRVLSVDTPALLNRYFRSLGGALSGRVETSEAARLEAEWRGLYPTAWADFYRFLAGWAPSEARADDYGRRLTDEVLDSLEREPQHPAEREPLAEHQPTTRRG